MAKLPLDGIRVLDMTIVFAGPFSTMMLADLGAEVILVESVHHVQVTRFAVIAYPGGVMRFPEILAKAPNSVQVPGGMYTKMFANKDSSSGRPWNRSAMWNRHTRNKLSCCVNLMDPKGREVVCRLAQKCDILVENNAVGFMDKMGLGYSVIKEWNPQIIYISGSGWGQTGPWSDRVSYGNPVEATTGYYWMMGYDAPDHPLNFGGAVHSDASTGGTIVLSALSALHHRNKTGKGQFIDVAIAETAMAQLPEPYLEYTMNGRNPRTIGNRDLEAAPCGCYPCYGEDRWVAITIYNDEQWRNFCLAIGNPPWTNDERFSTFVGRRQHQDEIDTLISEWTSFHNHYESMFILQKYGVPAGPVIDSRDAAQDPQLIARDYYELIQHREAGVHLYPGFLWKYTETPMSVRVPPCELGEHNEYVFKEVIGMSDDEYWNLTESETIGGEVYVGDIDYVKPKRPEK